MSGRRHVPACRAHHPAYCSLTTSTNHVVATREGPGNTVSRVVALVIGKSSTLTFCHETEEEEMNLSLPEYLVPRAFLQSHRRWGQKACQRISHLLHLHNQDLKRKVKGGIDQSPSMYQVLYDSFHPQSPRPVAVIVSSRGSWPRSERLSNLPQVTQSQPVSD